MKLNNSTLFVNTGRKPLPGMTKKKKTSKNNVALFVCVAIIAVLCLFVGLIAKVWVNYNEDVKSSTSSVDTGLKSVSDKTDSPDKPKAEPKTKENKKQETKEPAPEKPVAEKPKPKNYTSSGKETAAAKEVNKIFKNITLEYSYGIMNLKDEALYVKNPEKIENTAALAPFLAEYVSNAIYYGTFDYTTDVGGYQGSYLMDKAFTEGNVEAANLLISHFGTEKLNSYFSSNGYENTHFAGTVGEDGSYTTSEDLCKLMKKFYENTGFFPYSDMYKKMTVNTVKTKIMKSLPQGAYGANMSFTYGEETMDAAIIYTSKGNFVFVAMAEGDVAEHPQADKAMANSAKKICEKIK